MALFINYSIVNIIAVNIKLFTFYDKLDKLVKKLSFKNLDNDLYQML